MLRIKASELVKIQSKKTNTKPTSKPKPKADLVGELLNQIDLYNKGQQLPMYSIAPPLLEFAFCSWRNWRADLAWNVQAPGKFLVEVEGLSFDPRQSRHTTNKGYEADCLKYSVAALLGFKVIRVTRGMIRSGVAIELILQALGISPRGELIKKTSLHIIQEVKKVERKKAVNKAAGPGPRISRTRRKNKSTP